MPGIGIGIGSQFGRGLGGGFPPLPSGVWYDLNMDDTNTITLDGSDRVTAIADSQGGSVIGDGTIGTTPPDFIVDPTIGDCYHNVNNRYIMIPGVPLNESPGYTLLMVLVQQTLTVGSDRYYIGTGAGNNVWCRSDQFGGQDRMRAKHAGSGRFVIGSVIDLQHRLFMWRVNQAVGPRVRFQGSENTQSNGTNNYGNQNLFICQEDGGGTAVNTYIKRFVFWDRPLSNAEYNEVMATMASQYPWIVNP